jgi:hypothetical protein
LRSPYGVAAVVAVSVEAVSIVELSRGAGSLAASLAGAFIVELLVAVFIAASLPGRSPVRSSAAVTTAVSTMVIDVTTGTVAGGRMVSVRAGV